MQDWDKGTYLPAFASPMNPTDDDLSMDWFCEGVMDIGFGASRNSAAKARQSVTQRYKPGFGEGLLRLAMLYVIVSGACNIRPTSKPTLGT